MSSPDGQLMLSTQPDQNASAATSFANDRDFPLKPNIFEIADSSTRVIVYRDNALKASVVKNFTNTIVDGAIGISFGIGEKCCLTRIALSSATQVLVVTNVKGLRKLKPLLADYGVSKFAMHMDRLLLSLYLDHGVVLSKGVDMLSASHQDRDSPQAMMDALGGETILRKGPFYSTFINVKGQPSVKILALQAWSCYYATSIAYMKSQLGKCLRIYADYFHKKLLSLLANNMRHADCLEALKPTLTKNEVESSFEINKFGDAQLTLEVKVTDSDGNEGTHSLQSTRTKGKVTRATFDKSLHNNTINSVITLGKDRATQAETLRRDVIRRILTRDSNLPEDPFFTWIYLGKRNLETFPDVPNSKKDVSVVDPPSRPLNESQRKSVEAILSPNKEHKLILIRGPPGTGKTTVIASAVMSYMSSSRSPNLWLVARSNVAVKNIAEKLASVNFLDFRIIVASSFHLGWHEHLYGKIEPNLIVSDKLDSETDAARLLNGSKVILCTLSMLSTVSLVPITRELRPQVIIFDEASQIEIGEYLPTLYLFCRSLDKLVFIGDDKQLPPYGQEEIPELESVFEKPHLQKAMLLLDTQYRMPVPIGEFISKHVYDDVLKSAHPINSPTSCQFIDVHEGREELKGTSKVNEQEVKVAIGLARKLQLQSKSYRIITPYDAQRAALETGLKAEGLNWQDICFNVDSFQGNEDDYIIVSIVGTKKLGFLKEKRRVNVMLTRCKVKMIVLSSRKFVKGVAKESLVGKLEEHMGDAVWVDWKEALFGDFEL
ncbi:hypothetical protein D9758_003653 [Tetrapyrgos nigripes]|uniref:DNA2/NAM7 helicase-like C-terminal domain-containing protein n=1 Tax=Tetrapyrgos nigripes TaxID=182062 RepID=A0A8H5LS71_9AGAR|nr:hypothetical protein D9758_003653 [Tetrapyrgos nigripes]